MNKDYYKVLELNKEESSPEKIKENYRRLVKQYHPDVNKAPDAEEKFKEVQEAYDVLSDPEKKSMYDRYGTVNPQEAEPGPGWSPFGPGGFGFRWGNRQQERKERGENLKINISLSLEEIYEGVHKKLKVRKQCTCHRCNGSGSETNESTTCQYCHGTGMEIKEERTPFGFQQTMRPCSHCHGTGQLIKDPCPNCHGTGLVDDTTEIEFDVPAGMYGDSYFVVPGKGNDGPHRGVPGDLLVVVTELPNDKGLSRDEDNNLLYTLDAKITDLIYGADVEIPWIKGYKKIHIEAGTQPGKVITRFGEGLPNPNNPTGPKANYKITIGCKIPRVNDLHGKDRENFDRIKKQGNF